MNKCFKKIPRDDDEPGKGAYWTVDLEEMDDFADGMFKRRRSCGGGSGGGNNSANSSVTGTPKTAISNNAFLNGTCWTPAINGTPCKQPNIKNEYEFRTPQPAAKPSLSKASVPMTPLTMSMNYFSTPVKKGQGIEGHQQQVQQNQQSSAVLTPKVTANCTNRSPYTSLMRNNNNSASSINQNTTNLSTTAASTATFWSYPNLSLSQMGLDAEPPLPEIENNFYNIFSNEPAETTKLPELFQGNTATATEMNNNTNTVTEKDVVRMSPLSWLLSVSSQDTSLGLFDQSQQLLSEYLSLNNM